MKTMKNVLMILLGAALVLSLAGVGAAEPITEKNSNPTSSNFRVTYTIGDTYSVTVPVDVDLKDEENGNTVQNVRVDADLAPGAKLTISVESYYNWKMMRNGDDSGTSIEYTMKYGDAEDTLTPADSKSVVIYTIPTSVTGGTKIISFSTTDSVESLPAGTYTDTLTFTVTHTPAA